MARAGRTPRSLGAKIRPERTELLALPVLIAAVSVIVAIAYRPVLDAGALCFDDTQYLTDNRLVLNPSWQHAKRFLTEVLEPSTVRGYYQPLAMISLMLDVAAGGGPNHLTPFHRTSLMLHVLNTALVIFLLYQLFRRPVPAALIGLLFGLHPFTVETIAWIGERKTTLASFFALWCLIAHVRWARTSRRRWLAASAAACVLALMSKPTTTPLPVLLLLLDVWPLRRISSRAVLEKVHLFLLAGISAIITIESQGRTASMTLPEDAPSGRILYVLCHNIVFYLRILFWPTELSPHYPYPSPMSPASSAVLIGIVGTIVLALALALALALSLRWTRAVVVGWLFFFIAILPAMGVIGFSVAIASDKYLYLPSLGFAMILTWAATRVWEGNHGHSAGETPVAPPRLRSVVGAMGLVVVAAGIALAVAEGAATRHQIAYWRDTETLYRHMVRIAPGASIVHGGLANALYDMHRPEEAEAEYKEALRLNPNYYQAHTNYANLLADRRQWELAVRHYREALRIDGSWAEAHNNLGSVLLELGRDKEAADCFQAALLRKPDYLEALYNLRQLAMAQGRTEETIVFFRRALAVRPHHQMIKQRLEETLRASGRGPAS